MESNDDPINKTGCVKRDMDGWDDEGEKKIEHFQVAQSIRMTQRGTGCRTHSDQKPSIISSFVLCVERTACVLATLTCSAARRAYIDK